MNYHIRNIKLHQYEDDEIVKKTYPYFVTFEHDSDILSNGVAEFLIKNGKYIFMRKHRYDINLWKTTIGFMNEEDAILFRLKFQ